MVLSCVPVYTTQCTGWLWGRYSLSPGPKANCSTFMPGNPLSANSSYTLGNSSPKSSATMGTSPSACFTARNSFMPGPLRHSPVWAVFAP